VANRRPCAQAVCIFADEASLTVPATHFPTLAEAVKARDVLTAAGLGRFCVLDVHTGERAVAGPPQAGR
jgi:hypothetical protein